MHTNRLLNFAVNETKYEIYETEAWMRCGYADQLLGNNINNKCVEIYLKRYYSINIVSRRRVGQICFVFRRLHNLYDSLAELADALDLGSSSFGVRVQVSQGSPYGRSIATARNPVLKTGGSRDTMGIDTSAFRHMGQS